MSDQRPDGTAQIDVPRAAAGIAGNPGPFAPSGGGVTFPTTNENQASVLVNATSAGDAGNRATRFPGTALPSGWTPYGNPVTSAVLDNSLAFYNPNASADGGLRMPYTPSGAFRVAVLGKAPFGYEIGVAALSGGGAPTDSVGAQVDSTGVRLNFRVGGVFTGGAPSGPAPSAGTPVWLFLTRDGAGNWSVLYSFDRVLPLQAGASHAQAIVVADIYLSAFTQNDLKSIQIVDVEL